LSWLDTVKKPPNTLKRVKVHYILNRVCFLHVLINCELIKSSLLYGFETWRLTENNKKRVEGAEMDALRRSSRILRKEIIKN